MTPFQLTCPPGTQNSASSRNTEPSCRTPERGVALIVALVMLLVISIASVSVMRSAQTTDVVSENTRRQAQATQAAQAALRFCENAVVAGTLSPAAAAASVTQEEWQTFNNWMSGTAVSARREVSRAFVTSSDNKVIRSATFKLPQCMAQNRAVSGGSVVVITARGFSDNYTEDQAGRTTAGSVVWLQSIISLQGESI